MARKIRQTIMLLIHCSSKSSISIKSIGSGLRGLGFHTMLHVLWCSAMVESTNEISALSLPLARVCVCVLPLFFFPFFPTLVTLHPLDV